VVCPARHGRQDNLVARIQHAPCARRHLALSLRRTASASSLLEREPEPEAIGHPAHLLVEFWACRRSRRTDNEPPFVLFTFTFDIHALQK
jgi:hypothetical protein